MAEQVKHMIRFSPDLYAKLRKLAEREDRSINWEVNTAVKLLIERYEREHGALPVDQVSQADQE